MFFKPKEDKKTYLHKLTPKDISKIPFFYNVSSSDMELLADFLKIRVIWEDRYVFREGDVQTEMFFILEGSVDILKKDSKGNEELLVQLKSPQIFGEMALISGGRRSASVRANEETTIAELSYKDFEKLIMADPKLAVNIVREIANTLSSRLRMINSAYVELI